MVTIIDYSENISRDGKLFYSLKIQGGIEMVQSNETGNFYATAKRATIMSTFDELTCKGLIGTTMDGDIQKENCAPYEYMIKETGETIELSHRYVFVAETNKSSNKPKQAVSDIADESVFSKNGRSLEMA